MPYSHFDLEALNARLAQAKLAGFIYQHQQHMLILQEALNEDGSPLNNFVQHELSSDQLGLQFGLRLSQYDCKILKLEFLGAKATCH